MKIFLDPNDPEVIENALKQGIPHDWLEAAKLSPVYKMIKEWKIAFPLHPEYRTLPMVWYIPPLSPIEKNAQQKNIATKSLIPDVESLRIPNQYLANMLTAGKVEPIVYALKKLLGMRAFMRTRHVDEAENLDILKEIDSNLQEVNEMYRYLAIANYEDRYVIPTSKREVSVENAFALKAGMGFCTGSTDSEKINITVMHKPKNLFAGKILNENEDI